MDRELYLAISKLV